MKIGVIVLYSKGGKAICKRRYDCKERRDKTMRRMLQRYSHWTDRYIHIIPDDSIRKNYDLEQKKYNKMAAWKGIDLDTFG